MSERPAADDSSSPSYRAFARYYTLRTRVLGLQSALGTVVYRTVLHELGDAGRILDVACGRGMYQVPLAAAGRDVLGLDACESNVTLLATNGLRAVLCDCVDEMPAHVGRADAVLCAEFLEHLSDGEARRLLANVRRVLRDDGVLVVTVPYREDLAQEQVVCPRCAETFHRHGHVRAYDSADGLLAQVAAAGFRPRTHHVVSPTKRVRKLGLWRWLPFSLWLAWNRRKRRTSGRLVASFTKTLAPH